ncbi:MAG: hypothetical protein IT308_07395 [Anaerolineaceae bacterium]|nr:hypothetical protein [Anaerolineaceae bacterium]
MKTSHPGQPKITSIVIGIAISIVLLGLFLSLGEVVKILGAPFLIIPAQLGLVEKVTAGDIINFRLNTRETTLKFNAPGRYALYTADLDLLEITNSLEQSGAQPWLRIEPQAGGKGLEVQFVRRGLSPFDSALVRGRPVFTFVIEKPGVYVLRHTARKAAVAILPDVITGKEGILTLAYITQIGIIAVSGGFFFFRARRQHLKRIQEIQQLKRIRGEAFWEKEAEKQRTAADK